MKVRNRAHSCACCRDASERFSHCLIPCPLCVCVCVCVGGEAKETFLSVLWDIRNAGVSPRQVACFNLKDPGSCAADRVSSWHWLLEVLEPNLWPTPSKWIKVYGMFILY